MFQLKTWPARLYKTATVTLSSNWDALLRHTATCTSACPRPQYRAQPAVEGSAGKTVTPVQVLVILFYSEEPLLACMQQEPTLLQTSSCLEEKCSKQESEQDI